MGGGHQTSQQREQHQSVDDVQQEIDPMIADRIETLKRMVEGKGQRGERAAGGGDARRHR